MNLFFKNLDRLCALILITGLSIALCLGIDGETKSVIAVAAGYLFGRRLD